jgi:uncharacterized protein (DUF1015 family)
MVDILPFKGVRYGKDIDIEKVITPPYDIIDDEEVEEYHARHENNIIRLILGKKYHDDSPENNFYTRARDSFNRWLEEGVLKKDERPCIYLLEQEYNANGEMKKMLGIISLVKLEEFEKGVILPHEETLPRHVDDRFHLMSICGANFSQIFTMYSDPEMVIEKALADEIKRPPIYEVNSDGILNRLWKIDDLGIIGKVTAEMKDKKLFIADGHHRYTTALMVRDKMRKERGPGAYDYTMMYYTNMDSGGITILPAHRLLSNMDFDESKMRKIEEYFEIENVEPESMLKKLKEVSNTHHVFGLCFEGKCYLLKLKDEDVMDSVIDSGKSREWKRLDVTIIHSLLIDLIVDNDGLSYIIDEKEALEKANEKGNLVIFVNPTKVGEVKRIALNGEKMPGKATYFYPKLLTGLVMNRVSP